MLIYTASKRERFFNNIITTTLIAPIFPKYILLCSIEDVSKDVSKDVVVEITYFMLYIAMKFL